MMRLRERLANQYPSLGRVRRWLRANVDARSSVRASYSQNGEDSFIWSRLLAYDLRRSAYIDVGANHPTNLSNTFLLYRNNLRGIIVEPNPELLQLHRSIRPDDYAVLAGCGAEPAIGAFQILSTPVLGSFTNHLDLKTERTEVRRLDTIHVPIVPLDAIAQLVPCDYFCFTSIDAEGQDYEVVLGARHTLQRTLFLCIEANTEDAKQHLTVDLEDQGFVLIHQLGCNLVFFNSNSAMNQYRLHPDLDD